MQQLSVKVVLRDIILAVQVQPSVQAASLGRMEMLLLPLQVVHVVAEEPTLMKSLLRPEQLVRTVL